MTKRSNNQRKHRLNFKNKVDFVVPSENVLDLKKMQAEKMQVEEQKNKIKTKKGLFNRLKKSKPEAKERISFRVTEKRLTTPTPLRKKISFNPFKGMALSFVNVKRMILFLIAALVLILPIYVMASYHKVDELKGRVLGASWEAYDHLTQAGQAFTDLDFVSASSEFDSAISYFSDAQEMLQTVSGVLKVVPIKGSKVTSAERVLKAGEAISTAGQYVSKAFAPLVTFSEGQESFNVKFNFATALLLTNTNLKPAISELERAGHYLNNVSYNVLPEQYREQFLVVKENLPSLNSMLKETLDISDLVLKILGHDYSKRYLLVFQNNAELRPTGGFIGSYALVTIKDGVMSELEIPGGGSYDLNGWLREQVISPEPLHLVNPHWYFQDANWFPDFPASAQKLIWFFNESGGPSIDGMLAITPDVLESLLKLTGPIDLTENYGVVIDQNNFRTIIQEEAEKKFEETKESKKIISELTPLVFNKVLSLDQFNQLEALAVLNKLLGEKFMLFYFNDQELQNYIVDQGWGGEIKQTSQDYLSIINTNIGGGKTDLMIEELIDHKLSIEKDGTVKATVTLNRIHKGVEGDPLSGIKNIDFVRFYVPQESKLISVSGFDRMDPRLFMYPNEEYKEDADLQRIEQNVVIDEVSGTRISEEFGKTVFGNWIGTEPGKSSQVSITYQLPFKIKPTGLFTKTDSYNLFVQKQAGTKGSVFTSEITFPEKYGVLWQYPETDSLQVSSGVAKYTEVLNADHYLGFVLKD